MAYNPGIYQPYGQMYGQNYYQSYGQQSQMPQGQNPAQGQQPIGMIWVDGEVGAKAFQLPAGWPVNTPLPLWDTNDTIIYLKSTNQMGIPNPIQAIHYRMDETAQKQSVRDVGRIDGSTSGQAADMSQYVRKDEANGFVRKDDLEKMKTELMESIQGIGTGTTVKRGAKGE